ncbi:hypothetical protein W97_07168 [Coniosporium apollinis CBS 100218]|uniref:Replication factor C subunit 1 n=1 Tax=Coniosporium apollinis (strain CBS 100218) TaxID=1168221 RepID=R7Z275_CONA1|nr:uncharacterized protein W97_07168 [Coniosporium apollinis CBS 100218]EON68021.1 hypothetical protein W97_07168 [Coniosporium apollinis CBS 100218]
MPGDIRSFFGGKPSQASQEKAPAKKDTGAVKPRARNTRVVIDDSDDEDFNAAPKKATPKKASPAKRTKRAPSPAGEATTTTDYFGAKNKPKRSAASKSKSAVTEELFEQTPKATPVKTNGKAAKSLESTPAKSATNGRTSSRKKKTTTYAEIEDHDDDFVDGPDGGDDVFTADFKRGRRKGDDYKDASDNDPEPVALPKRVPAEKSRQKKLIKEEDDFDSQDDDVNMQDVKPEDDFVVPDDDERIVVDKPAKAPAKRGRKRKSLDDEDDEDEDEPPKKRKGTKATPTKKTPAKKKAKKDDEPENATMQAIYDSIPLVRPPTPPEPSDEAKKFPFGGHANSGPPPAAGAKDIPTGAENCLAGLTFVFTGLLQTLSREDGQALVKRYGGKVTSGPSKKTNFVVLGSDAGPKKLQTIRDNGIKTIDEDGLFELIRKLPANGGSSKAAAAHAEKQEAQLQKIKEQAAEMEKADRRTGGAGGAGTGKASSSAKDSSSGPDSRLWTVKYAPTHITQICGNKGQVEKLQNWLRNFPKSQKTGFKLAGKDGSGVYRAVIIHGPPGIGKTTAAHLVAKLEGYDIVESNASDTRSKKLVETGLKGVLSTTSLLGYFAGDGKKVDPGKKKLVLIMDEVDGMSAGDRGGVGALAAVCKKTQIPMILICNDRKLPKMKPFDYCTYDIPFRRPTTEMIRSRVMTVAFREGLKMPPPVIDALIEGTGADIRQVINMISTAKLDEEAIDFDSGKAMSKAWEKHVILKPWDITSKILGGGMFSSSSKATLNDKIELYFNDHEFSYLMLQENYLSTNPILSNNYSGREKNLKWLELADKAAESISDGDLVDRMIHGSQQQWSLMPTHAVFSFVRPASFISGSMAGNKMGFTSWLGKNSTQGKLTRMVKEIQGHMRLRSSGDRHEIRQQYVPTLWTKLVRRLQREGKDVVDEVIDLMDSYFLTRDDFDAIMELGVGPMDQEKVTIETATKSAFTRIYNQKSHPLPFMKASNVVAPKKQTKEQPDLEEAIEESDEGEVVEEIKEEDDEDVDLSKDKYVKQPKKKAAPKKAAPQKSSAKAGKKGSKAAKEEASEEESEEEVKPKGRGKGKAATRGRGKK